MKIKEPQSLCCKAPVKVMGREGHTRWWVCAKCDKPCDAILYVNEFKIDKKYLDEENKTGNKS